MNTDHTETSSDVPNRRPTASARETALEQALINYRALDDTTRECEACGDPECPACEIDAQAERALAMPRTNVLEAVLRELVNACNALPASDGRTLGLNPILARAELALEESHPVDCDLDEDCSGHDAWWVDESDTDGDRVAVKDQNRLLIGYLLPDDAARVAAMSFLS